jgi:tRNA A37 threonylcarbamoyladenosine modification protein TsaB
MILFLDTSSFEEVRFATIGKSVKEKKYPLLHIRSAETLKLLSQFLGKKKLDGVEKIIVVSGPGSFSGIRVGIALAEGFGLAKQIPVYAILKSEVPKNLEDLTKAKKLKKITEDFNPDYGAEPNITISKK